MTDANRASRISEAARREPTAVELEELGACLDADSRAARGHAAEALGRLALAGRDVEPYADRLGGLLADTELLDAGVRLSVDPDAEGWFQPRVVAFAAAALVLTGSVERADTIESAVRAYERSHPEFDAETRTVTAVREVGWALASVVIYTDGYVDVLVSLTERDDDLVRRVAASALSDVAEEYPPIRDAFPDETPRLVAVAAESLASDPHPRVRYHAAFALYEYALGRPELVRGRRDVLVAALEDESELVRKDAAGTLGLVGATDAVPALRELAESDPADRVRGSAADALESLGEPE
ncbi:HEAT repeat domain-containing protein [Halobellus limi]|jgi:hypothetical protein|uniref:HEAT repeat domain-containing protein n=1 Tax=Halobellus limi TaxID=699433 RepID=A0A1H6BCU2_9EURY|nr:HEAT repeat domain-containing protein [Halobellus limi]QCC49257.1 HEAT repeat domain-containing protein [Halobellus limi]SEG58185.1 HEAT repeat-containing protein [Halobellus limi]